MISVLGRALVLLGLLFAASGSLTAWEAGRTGKQSLWDLTRRLSYAFSGSMIGANLLMIYALLVRDFSVSYVAEVGSWASPTHIAIVSLWASLNGSILFWGGVLGVYVAVFTRMYAHKHRAYTSWTLAVLLGVSVFFAWLVAGIANPFAATEPELMEQMVAIGGKGPNPLLQNHLLMIVHPPMLYLGFVGFSVPFSMAAAGLLAGRLEAGWIQPLRNWALVPWAFLTVAIMLGGWWSYEVLGWGGYWAWDPVENASFHPWLTGTAFLHSAMLMQRKGVAKTWSVVLMFATFWLTLLGTFMTRSGVFNSVHSFTASDIGPVFLGFMAVVFLGCSLLLAFRGYVLEDNRPDTHSASDVSNFLFRAFLGDTGKVHPLSRGFAILLQNFLFTVFTFVVVLGTVYPLIMEAYDGRRLSVGEPYFDGMTLPIGALIVFLMGVGPALPWGRAKNLNNMVAPSIGAVVGVLLGAAGGFTLPGTLVSLAVCGFAAGGAFQELTLLVLARARTRNTSAASAALPALIRSHRKTGAQVAHLGIVMVVVSIALSKGYKVEQDFAFEAGATEQLGDYAITYTGSRMEKQPHRDSVVASFLLTKNGRDLGVQSPRLNFYPTQRTPIGTPAVYSTVAGDVYFSLMSVAEDGSSAEARVMVMPAVPWLWLGVFVIAAGAFIVLLPVPPARKSDAPTVASTAGGEQAA